MGRKKMKKLGKNILRSKVVSRGSPNFDQPTTSEKGERTLDEVWETSDSSSDTRGFDAVPVQVLDVAFGLPQWTFCTLSLTYDACEIVEGVPDLVASGKFCSYFL
jgi:hypothetical protein